MALELFYWTAEAVSSGDGGVVSGVFACGVVCCGVVWWGRLARLPKRRSSVTYVLGGHAFTHLLRVSSQAGCCSGRVPKWRHKDSPENIRLSISFETNSQRASRSVLRHLSAKRPRPSAASLSLQSIRCKLQSKINQGSLQ